MSNLSGRKKNLKKSAKSRTKSRSAVIPLSTHPVRSRLSETTGLGAQNDAQTKIKRWSFIQNDLEKALDTWQELEKGQASLSPEEEQLEKIKTIIGQLKDKLNQF